MPIDLERVFQKIHASQGLLPEELEEIASFFDRMIADPTLFERTTTDDIYTLICILSRARAYQYRTSLEKCFARKEAFTVSLLLETLCLDWNLTEEYLEQVIHFAIGVAWDEEEDVRQTALKILGEYLYSRLRNVCAAIDQTFGAQRAIIDASSMEEEVRLRQWRKVEWKVLELLLSVYAELVPCSLSTRKSAYYALCRSSGLEWGEISANDAKAEWYVQSSSVDNQLTYRLRSLLGASGVSDIELAVVSECSCDESASLSSNADVTGLPGIR